jgi:hypothetical protein
MPAGPAGPALRNISLHDCTTLMYRLYVLSRQTRIYVTPVLHMRILWQCCEQVVGLGCTLADIQVYKKSRCGFPFHVVVNQVRSSRTSSVDNAAERTGSSKPLYDGAAMQCKFSKQRQCVTRGTRTRVIVRTILQGRYPSRNILHRQ